MFKTNCWSVAGIKYFRNSLEKGWDLPSAHITPNPLQNTLTISGLENQNHQVGSNGSNVHILINSKAELGICMGFPLPCSLGNMVKLSAHLDCCCPIAWHSPLLYIPYSL